MVCSRLLTVATILPLFTAPTFSCNVEGAEKKALHAIRPISVVAHMGAEISAPLLKLAEVFSPPEVKPALAAASGGMEGVGKAAELFGRMAERRQHNLGHDKRRVAPQLLPEKKPGEVMTLADLKAKKRKRHQVESPHEWGKGHRLGSHWSKGDEKRRQKALAKMERKVEKKHVKDSRAEERRLAILRAKRIAHFDRMKLTSKL